MKDDVASEGRRHILDRLAKAGAGGLSIGGLKLPGASSAKGRAYRDVLNRLQKAGEIGNLGSRRKPRYVLAEYFKPMEIAYEHIEKSVRGAGLKLSSKTALFKKLGGAALHKAEDALKLLVDEGILVRLKWAGKALYVHACALPGGTTREPAVDAAIEAGGYPNEAAIARAYRETVNEFGYPDVLIHEVFRRAGGRLELFKAALLEACRAGRAVPGVGDWSLCSPEERDAAIYVNGQPHLRIRFKE